MSLAVHEQQKVGIETKLKDTTSNYEGRIQQLSQSYFSLMAYSTSSWWERIESLEASFLAQFSAVTSDWWSRMSGVEDAAFKR